MKVLGIDPGTAACGYGIVQEKGGRVRAIDYGWWKTPASDRPEARLKTIFDAVTTLIDQAAPDAVALEESFVGVDARTALSVGQARGAIMVAAALAGVECAEYSRPASSRPCAAMGGPRRPRCSGWCKRSSSSMLRRPRTMQPTRWPSGSATRWRRPC